MSASWRWLIVGLCAAVLLFAVGWVIGHRGATTSDEDRRAWQQVTDLLLGDAREQHRRVIDSLAAMARADSIAAREAERRANRAGRAADSLAAEADTLAASLVVARYSIDSIHIYQGMVISLDRALTEQTARGDTLEAALDAASRQVVTWRNVADLGARRELAMQETIEQLRREQRGSPLRRITRAVETVAIGAVTVQACRDPISYGCAAGAVVTIARIL